MKRKTILIGLMMGLMLATMALPAHADLLGIEYRVATSLNEPIALEGMSFTVDWDPAGSTLGCGHMHVESAYIVRTVTNSVADNIEFGWSRYRNTFCTQTTDEFFIAQHHNGVEYTVINFQPICCGFPGFYRLTEYVDNTDHLFHFFYDDPNGIRRIVVDTNNVPVTANPNAWNTWSVQPGRGAGIVSEEVTSMSDQLGYEHANVWARSMSVWCCGWSPVNATHGPSYLKFHNRGFCGEIYTPGSGSIGDALVYGFAYPTPVPPPPATC
jgi:hypothetical protein